jgi:hypothetical protein
MVAKVKTRKGTRSLAKLEAKARAAKTRLGRPADPNARKVRVLVQLNDAEKTDLDRLVKLRNEDLASESVTVNAQDVFRWLLSREMRARGDA